MGRWLSTSCQLGGQGTSSSHQDISSGDVMWGQAAGKVPLECLTITSRNCCTQKATMRGARLVSSLFWIAAHCTIKTHEVAHDWHLATNLLLILPEPYLEGKGRAQKGWIISTEMQTQFNLRRMMLLQVNLKRKVMFLYSFCTDNIRSHICFEW